MRSASAPLPLWYRLLPWGAFVIVALPLLFLHWPAPDSALGSWIIATGELVRPISAARLFEDRMPLLASSAWTLAVLDWQSLSIAAMFCVGVLGIVGSPVRTGSSRHLFGYLGLTLLYLIAPVVLGLLVIGPIWAGYDMPSGDRNIDIAHILLIGVGSLIGLVPIMAAAALWTLDRQQLGLTADSAILAPMPIMKNRTASVARLFGWGGLERTLRLTPVALALVAWAVLRFQDALPDAWLLAFIDTGEAVRPLAVTEWIGWNLGAISGLDSLQDEIVQAFRDWQGVALTLGIFCGIGLLVLRSPGQPSDKRFSWALKGLVTICLMAAFLYWFVGGAFRPRLDPSTWQAEISTLMVLFVALGLAQNPDGKSQSNVQR